MRSIRLLAAAFSLMALGSACGDGGGTPPPENRPPVAGFSEVCTNLSCVFTDASTDPDGNTDITARNWSFGDGTPAGAGTSVTHGYAGPNTYTAVLRVTDNGGLSSEVSKNITVTAAPPGNQAPVAGFSLVATDNSVAFINISTDADGTITYLWNFGEPASGVSNESNLKDPTHGYTITAPATFTVTLTVTDDDGATDVETQTVTVAPPAVNTAPTAGFIHTCTNAVCAFTSTSTDAAPGTIATYAWDFGDFGTAAISNPSHSYAITVSTTFTVTLTVTDDRGASDVESQTITVAPPPPVAQGCTVGGTASNRYVDCALDITARSTVRLKLLGISCLDRGQKVVAAPPINDQVFLSVCLLPVGEDRGIFGGPEDHAIVYEAGTQVVIRFHQGTTRKPGELLPAAPAARFTGTFPDWTIEFEDGFNPTGAGEPDFADVVVGVRAVAAP